jgi:hypothetical protein
VTSIRFADPLLSPPHNKSWPAVFWFPMRVCWDFEVGLHGPVVVVCFCAHTHTQTHILYPGLSASPASWSTRARYIILRGVICARSALSKAVLSSICLELPEPWDYLPSRGYLFTAALIYRGLYHSRLPMRGGSAASQTAHLYTRGTIAILQVIQLFSTNQRCPVWSWFL